MKFCVYKKLHFGIHILKRNCYDECIFYHQQNPDAATSKQRDESSAPDSSQSNTATAAPAPAVAAAATSCM